MASDYFSRQEISNNLNKNKLGGIGSKIYQHITGKQSLNVGVAKKSIATYFGGKIKKIRKSDGSFNKEAFIGQLRDKYEIEDLTPEKRKKLADVIMGVKSGPSKDALRKIKGYNKYVQGQRMKEMYGDIKSDLDKKREQRAQRARNSRSAAAGLTNRRRQGEMSSEEIKESVLKRVLTEDNNEKVTFKRLGLRDDEREKAQSSALADKVQTPASVAMAGTSPAGEFSGGIKSGTIGVGGGIGVIKQSGNIKSIGGSRMNLNNSGGNQPGGGRPMSPLIGQR
ncbi:MAG: hypothetical protein MUC28_02360 [Planctomycetes bacterium]|jgi:hypothetical protein|nr:hypothetical protein [Planctomycetota bacterium]